MTNLLNMVVPETPMKNPQITKLCKMELTDH